MKRLAKLICLGSVLGTLAACGGSGGGSNFSSFVPNAVEGTPIEANYASLRSGGERLIGEDVRLRDNQQNQLPISGSAIYQGVAAVKLESNFNSPASGDREDNIVLFPDYIGTARIETNFGGQPSNGVSGRGVKVTAGNFFELNGDRTAGTPVAGSLTIDNARLSGGKGLSGDLAGNLTMNGVNRTLSGEASGLIRNEGNPARPEVVRIGVTNGVASSSGDAVNIRTVIVGERQTNGS